VFNGRSESELVRCSSITYPFPLADLHSAALGLFFFVGLGVEGAEQTLKQLHTLPSDQSQQDQLLCC
ncbi:hypothetical protein Dimus_001543, partial [Dionaea muscipula]